MHTQPHSHARACMQHWYVRENQGKSQRPQDEEESVQPAGGAKHSRQRKDRDAGHVANVWTPRAAAAAGAGSAGLVKPKPHSMRRHAQRDLQQIARPPHIVHDPPPAGARHGEQRCRSPPATTTHHARTTRGTYANHLCPVQGLLQAVLRGGRHPARVSTPQQLRWALHTHALAALQRTPHKPQHHSEHGITYGIPPYVGAKHNPVASRPCHILIHHQRLHSHACRLLRRHASVPRP